MYSKKERAAYNRQRRVTFQERYKRGKPCMDCGGIFHPCQMHFDHRDPEEKTSKYSSPAQMYQSKWGKIEIELAKCDLVCANCHALRTYLRGDTAHRRG